MKTYSVIAGQSILIPSTLQPNKKFFLMRLEANNYIAAARWVQAFSGRAVPANTTVPLIAPLALAASGNNARDYTPGGIEIAAPGLVLAVSTTQGALTLGGAADVDINAVIEDFEFPPLSTLVAGDYVTGVKSLQVWAEAAGPKTLIRVEAKNTTGGTLYVQVFARDNPADGLVPIRSVPILTNAFVDLNFGDGFIPFRKDADGTERNGCTVLFSTTQNTKTLVGANSGVIKAVYK